MAKIVTLWIQILIWFLVEIKYIFKYCAADVNKNTIHGIYLSQR